jgi:hypothetical protein
MSNESPTESPSFQPPNPIATNEQAGNESQQAQNPQTHGDFVAGISNIPPSPSQSTKPENDKKTTDKWGWIKPATFFIEVLGFGGLIWYCIISQRELRVFDEERKTMENEFKVAQTNSVLEQRAWVGVIGFDAEFTPNSSSPEQVKFGEIIKNSGKTPAINVVPIVGGYRNKKDIPATDAFPNPINSADFLMPDNTSIIPSTLPPNQVNASDVEAGKSYYIAGTIWYDDIFGNHHWSQFCYSVTPDLKTRPMPFHHSCDDVKPSQTK